MVPEHQTPIADVFSWNMAGGVGGIGRIADTFEGIKRKASADGVPAIIALQEANLPEGHDAFDEFVKRVFPDWEIIHFSHKDVPTMRKAHGHTILLSPQLRSRRNSEKHMGGHALPKAAGVFDLFVEEHQRGKSRVVQMAAVDFPPQDGRELTVVIANAHLDLDIRGGPEHKIDQVVAVREALTQGVHAIVKPEDTTVEHDVFVVVTGDFNSGRKILGRRHTEKMKHISHALGEQLVEATRRGTTANLLRSVDLFFASTHVPWLKKMFHENSPVRRGLRHIEFLVPEIGGRSLDHVFVSPALIAGETFTIDEHASDHVVVGVPLYRRGKKDSGEHE